jgi:DNA-directed RNA polymerase subunit RPC12/RpoP
MPIVVHCPECRVRLTLGDDRAGHLVDCPKCSEAVRVPAAVAEPDPVRFACPACGKTYHTTAGNSGRTVACVQCRAAVVVPKARPPRAVAGIPLPPKPPAQATEPPPPSEAFRFDSPQTPLTLDEDADRNEPKPRYRAPSDRRTGKLVLVTTLIGIAIVGGSYAVFRKIATSDGSARPGGAVDLSWSPNLGTRLDFGNGCIYYTASVPVEDARRLGNYLVARGFFAGNSVTLQLNKFGNEYQVRDIVKKGIDRDEAQVKQLKSLCREISFHVFGGQHVEMHLCDDSYNTIRVVLPS